jgi:hypothetical protein
VNLILRSRNIIAEEDSVHKFSNEIYKTAHILCLQTPAGMEKMFQEMGKPVSADTLPPIQQMTHEELIDHPRLTHFLNIPLRYYECKYSCYYTMVKTTS